ncbi:hypothetical protein HY404_03655 [Candidatus Microgenomates bacterium]|nr:hypothetical protein [Candidatus Microgenomates bacterium]
MPREKELVSTTSRFPVKFSKKWLWVVGVIAVLVVLGVVRPGWFIAATVNGYPITSIELFGRLNQDYRIVGLENLINEKVILGEAASRNAIPTQAEVNEQVNKLEEQYGGKEAFAQVLSYQGQNRASFTEQIRIELAVKKMYESEASISAEEIDKFIKENKTQLTATDSAGQKKEAEEAVKQQKLMQIIQAKFQELKQKAKVKIF